MGITPPTAETTPPTPPKTRLPETDIEKTFFQAIKENRFQGAVNAILRAPAGKPVPVAELADEQGMTALHWAVSNKNMAGIRWLLDKKADPNLEDEQGRTPLKIALDNKDQRAMAMLLDRGANPVLALPGHDAAEFNAFKKTNDLVDFMIKTAAADAAKPPPPAAVAPTNDATTVEPARIEPAQPVFRRTLGPHM